MPRGIYPRTEEHKRNIGLGLLGKRYVLLVEKICLVCGKRFKIYPSLDKTRKHCSRKCSYKSKIGKKHSAEWKRKTSLILQKMFNTNDPEQIKRRKEHERCRQKEYRHRLGISKKYRVEYTKTPEEILLRKRLHRKRYKALKKNGGELAIEKIQMVYEDNIKRYGTLTCYLCEQPIPFGRDHLEHKTPLSRGGTNEYNNLAIACQHCNCKKHSKTEEEYREEIKIL